MSNESSNLHTHFLFYFSKHFSHLSFVPRPLIPNFSPCFFSYILFTLWYHQANINMTLNFLKQTFHGIPVACRVNSRHPRWQTQLCMVCRPRLSLTALPASVGLLPLYEVIQEKHTEAPSLPCRHEIWTCINQHPGDVISYNFHWSYPGWNCFQTTAEIHMWFYLAWNSASN